MHVSAAALPLLILTLIGAFIRLAVAGQDLFADELSTYWIVSTNGLGGVLSTVYSNAEISPPLPFLAGWLAVQVDSSPELLRAPALLAGVATIPLVYLVGARSVGRLAGLVAAALTAFAPFMIYYSAEARGYALMMAFVTGSTLAMLMAIDERRARWWVLYGACSCAAVYTHYTSVFVLAAQLMWVLWRHPELRRPAILANLAAAVAFLPWVPGLLADMRSPTTEILSALQPFDWPSVRLSLQHWSIGYPYAIVASLRDVPGKTALDLLALALFLSLGGGLMRLVRGSSSAAGLLESRTLLLVGLMLATPVGAALFTASGGTAMFSTRNLAASWPGFALALGAACLAAGPRARYLAAALAVLSFAIGASKLLREDIERPPYTEVAGFIERSAGPRDVVIDESAALSPGPLSHLDTVLRRPLRVFRSRAPEQRDRPFGLFDHLVSPAEASRKAVAAAAGERIFLVTDGWAADLRRPMSPYRLVEERTFEGMINLVVQVYRPPP